MAVGLFASRWSAAQSTNRTTNKGPITGANNPELEGLSALISYLEANNQTNALKLFYDYRNASIALERSADMGLTLHTLMALREGRTNDAIQLMEIKLDSDIINFADSFQELPQAQREWLGLHTLSEAKWYRTKFPDKQDSSIAHAFELLDAKSRK